MAIKLPSIVGKPSKREPELNVNSKDDLINKKINQRLKRKEMLAEAMNKIHDKDIA